MTINRKFYLLTSISVEHNFVRFHSLKKKKKEHNHQQYWTASQNLYSNLKVFFLRLLDSANTLLSLDNIRDREVLLVLSSCSYGYVVVAKQNVYPSLHVPFLKKENKLSSGLCYRQLKKMHFI